MLTASKPSIKPLANIVSCYICSDRQYERKNTFHFSHLPSRINGRARPQNHYTTLFAKKIQETMPRAEFSDRGKSPSSYNLSVCFARQGRVAAPSIRRAPLASCWPLPQQLLPVSATGGGRRRCPRGGAIGMSVSFRLDEQSAMSRKQQCSAA